MSKILRQNVGGTNFTMAGCALTGVCASAAADYVKVVTLSDGDELSDGMTVIVAFANGNTAGTAPASTTIYSSDQINYYTDAGLTVPFTLAPAGCYEITYTGEGNAYNYIAYPVMQAGSVSGPLCDASGNKASGALWLAGDKVSINYANGCFNVIPQAPSLMTVTAASSVVNGAPVRAGSTVRIMFTTDIAGVDTSTVLTLKYNGVDIPVRVGKNGALADFNAFEVSSGVYKYLQAYTTLELMFDGTQFIIIGNPVVLSSADYTIYPDGAIVHKSYTVVRGGGLNIANIQAKIGAPAFYYYKTNRADYAQFGSGVYQNGNIVNKQGTWRAELINQGTVIEGNDINDVWTIYPISI